MKINKILAAGVAATLAVTSLSAVVSAIPAEPKTFDMARSVGVMTLKAEQTLNVDFLASTDENGGTIANPGIIGADGTITIDLSKAKFKAPYHSKSTDNTINTEWILASDLDITSVKLVVTGIQGAKNATSKDYEYSFNEQKVNHVGTDVFTLDVHSKTGKGFVPTQFVEITKVKYVVEAKFETETKLVYTSAKDGHDDTWGSTLVNYTVNGVTGAKIDLNALKTAYTTAQAATATAKTALDAAQKAYDTAVNNNTTAKSDAQEAYDAAVKNLTEVNSQAQIYKANQTPGALLTADFTTAVNNRVAATYGVNAAGAVGAGTKTLNDLLKEANTEKTTATTNKTNAAANKASADELYNVAKQAVLNADAGANITENADGTSAVAWATAPASAAELATNFQTAYAQKVTYANADAVADAALTLANTKITNIQAKIDELDEAVNTAETAMKSVYEKAKTDAKAALDGVADVPEAVKTALETAQKNYDDALAAESAAKYQYEEALKSGGKTILEVVSDFKTVCGGWGDWDAYAVANADGSFTGAAADALWIGYDAASLETRYAPLPRTTTDTTIDRYHVEVLSDAHAYNATNIYWTAGTVNQTDYNQTYKNDDVHQGTNPNMFAGLTSQAADYFNKSDNGKIVFKFTPATKAGDTWLAGGVPSTEVGLKSALAGTNFGLFFNYNASTGQLVSLGQVDSDALTITFDISDVLDDLDGHTKGVLEDIYYGLNTGIEYLAPYWFTGYLVETITFTKELPDENADVNSETETVDEEDDDDTTTVDEEEDDDDDDFIADDEDDDDDDDTAAVIDDEDDDDDDTPAVVISDDKDDTNTNNDVVIVTPTKEDDDANPGTGVGLAVLPVIAAAAAMVVSKKRK